MFAVFSAIKIASELPGSHSRQFLGSAASNAVKRHGPAEVTHERTFVWPCGDTSELLPFSAVPNKHLRTFNYITDKNCLFALLYADTSILLFLPLNSHLDVSNNGVDETFPTVQ